MNYSNWAFRRKHTCNLICISEYNCSNGWTVSLATGTTKFEMPFPSHHKQINIDPWTKAPPKPNIDSVALDRSAEYHSLQRGARLCFSLCLFSQWHCSYGNVLGTCRCVLPGYLSNCNRDPFALWKRRTPAMQTDRQLHKFHVSSSSAGGNITALIHNNYVWGVIKVVTISKVIDLPMKYLSF